MEIILEISNDFIKLKLLKIIDKVYLLEINDRYDRGMLFSKYQEFYESPYDELKGKPFDLCYLMKVYKTKNDQTLFTYTDDWSGYNIPSYSLKECFQINQEHNISMNLYDKVMLDIYNKITEEEKEFYLIGTDESN
jgi:hypothetical protein